MQQSIKNEHPTHYKIKKNKKEPCGPRKMGTKILFIRANCYLRRITFNNRTLL